ncbi:MAG: hypothetical protein JSW71_05195, partial [Gemmatimonadota bacterium]
VLQLGMPPDPQLTRGQALSNDVPVGPDLLNIASEVGAIADAIALKDMNPPLVVGVLGGWGAGKSFVLHLLEKRLQEIRCERVHDGDGEEGAGYPNFPFVGHPYVIRFDAWTYAKGNLWASLMQTIFLELERQLSLEQILHRELKIDPCDNTEIWRLLSRLGDDDRDRLTKTKLGVEALGLVREFDAGIVSEQVLWDNLAGLKSTETARLRQRESELAAAQVDRDRAHRALEERIDAQLAKSARKAAWRPVTSAIVIWARSDLKARLEAAGDGEEIQLPTFEEVRSSIAWYKKLLIGWGGLPLAFAAFAGLALVAGLTIPDASMPISGLASLGNVLLGALTMAVKGYNSLETQRKQYDKELNDELAKEKASREELIKEAVLAAAATGAQRGPGEVADRIPSEQVETHPLAGDQEVASAALTLHEADVRLGRKQAEVVAQRNKIGITARHDSLMDLVRQRIEGKYYEDKLGLLQQVQADLAELSAALLPSRARQPNGDHAGSLEELFPRGQPRIVLIVDDLDRCPPKTVVDVLEAAQLLVKSPLFVVVLAMDVRYITRALEKAYVDVLVRGGEPSGLDYIEKIVQIPYRVRPISPTSVGGFLRAQMLLEKLREEIPEATLSGGADAEEVEAEITSPTPTPEQEGEFSRVAAAKPIRSELRPLPTRILHFNRADYETINLCCGSVEVNPRAMKRLVNIFKLLKIIWFRQGLDGGPEPPVKQTMLALLALAARFPDVTRQLLRHMEGLYRPQSDSLKQSLPASLAARCEQGAETAIYPPDWESVRLAFLDPKLFPQDLTFHSLQESNFNLISSFSFVGETDAEREAALQNRARILQ